MSAIAIDGPAGAGKSTVARAVAEALGWTYVDTGAMYRAVALGALEGGVDLGDVRALVDIAGSLDLDGRASPPDPARLRATDVTRAASTIASVPAVREVLARKQRALARSRDVVMEGRDIGAEVVPEADVKIFLTASPRVRAGRRARQLGRPRDARTITEIEAALVARDEADASRDASPLTIAVDAKVIDSSDLDVDDVVRLVLTELDRATDD
jgi:CMP/dCMP kinase